MFRIRSASSAPKAHPHARKHVCSFLACVLPCPVPSHTCAWCSLFLLAPRVQVRSGGGRFRQLNNRHDNRHLNRLRLLRAVQLLPAGAARCALVCAGDRRRWHSVDGLGQGVGMGLGGGWACRTAGVRRGAVGCGGASEVGWGGTRAGALAGAAGSEGDCERLDTRARNVSGPCGRGRAGGHGTLGS